RLTSAEGASWPAPMLPGGGWRIPFPFPRLAGLGGAGGGGPPMNVGPDRRPGPPLEHHITAIGRPVGDQPEQHRLVAPAQGAGSVTNAMRTMPDFCASASTSVTRS